MTPEQTQLLELFEALAPSERDSLLAFAEFLKTRVQLPDAQRSAVATAPVQVQKPTPQVIPRPDKESVVAALKRLSATYPMLDKNKLLTDTSGLVTQHIMQRRDSVEVIDEMEAIFISHYQIWSSDTEQD